MSNFYLSILLTLCLSFPTLSLSSQTLKDKMKPVVKDGGFKMEGYFTWCPSVIKVGKTYHMFASRWPAEHGMGGWTGYSEVVRATSDNVLGPYTFQEVVLQKRPGFWDKDRAHNPKILKIGDTYVLFYISTANKTGYAFSSSITGPWTRSDAVAMPFSNPAPFVHPNGNMYVFGRLSVNDIRIAQAYTAPSFKGPYTLLNQGKNLLPGLNQLEDPTIWRSANQYHVICSDFRGDVTGVNKQGVQYYSADGLTFQPASTEPVYTHDVLFDNGSKETFKRRERPSIYVDDKNRVTAFFTAVLPQEGPAYILAQPVDNYRPKAFKEIKSPSDKL